MSDPANGAVDRLVTVVESIQARDSSGSDPVPLPFTSTGSDQPNSPSPAPVAGSKMTDKKLKSFFAPEIFKVFINQQEPTDGLSEFEQQKQQYEKTCEELRAKISRLEEQLKSQMDYADNLVNKNEQLESLVNELRKNIKEKDDLCNNFISDQLKTLKVDTSQAQQGTTI